MIRQLIRVDGSVEFYHQPISTREIARLIGADGLDTVILRHMGHPLHVMLVDDIGLETGRAVNPAATDMYRKNCIPGAKGFIAGDVFIAPDSDF